MESIYEYLVIRWAATHPLSALQNVDMIINGLAKGGFLTMGTKRVGLARTQALIENLKRSLDFNGSTFTDIIINTARAVTLSGTNTLSGDTTASGQLKATGNNLAATAGTGITSGTNTVCISSATFEGNMVVTKIFIDLTGLTATSTHKDIIGKTGGTANCSLGKITTARCGTIVRGTIECIEVPNGEKDIDLWESSVATGAQDADASTLANAVRLQENNENWSQGDKKLLDTLPSNDRYLYFATGGSTGATYTQGQYEITLYGTQ
jgi:hypothetical protein